jgi:[protein-PII] uridylyltransferase
MTQMDFSTRLRTVSVVIERGATLGRWDVTFQSEAVPGTLAVFAGVLALSRLDIASAIVRRDGDISVRDTFDVMPIDGATLGPEHEALLASLAADALCGRRDLEADLRAARRTMPPKRAGVAAAVNVSTDSELTTGITVRAADRLGLLHDIAASLTRYGLRTRSLTVLTYGGQAHDSFRVVGADGLPVRDKSLLCAVHADLMRVCEA